MQNPSNPTNTDKSAANNLGTGIGPIVAGPMARGETRQPSSNASREIHSFLADIETLVKDATSLSGDELSQAKAKLGARIATVKKATEVSDSNLMQRARQTAAVTNGYVHQQPWKAVGAGAAVAFVLGRVISKRS